MDPKTSLIIPLVVQGNTVFTFPHEVFESLRQANPSADFRIEISSESVENSRDSRLQKLRLLQAEEMRLHDIYNQLKAQTDVAHAAWTKARAEAVNRREDFVGDLFNGCFGQEWLLDPK